MVDIAVVGGGPAGLTAAVYARRAGKTVLVIERAAFGGQITWSPRVENFPGTISVSGTELGDRLLEQAMEQGAEVELEEVTELCVPAEREPFILKTASGAEFEARTVILATGAKPRKTGLENEEKLIGNGVCFCAVCDGAFYAGKPVAVYGGGNSALQDALLLSEKCSEVFLIHRRDTFRGEAKLVEALRKKTNVRFILNARIEALHGDQELTGIAVNENGTVRELPVSGLFVAIGHEPDTVLLRGKTALNEKGYVVSDERCLTEIPGIFTAGDCRAKGVRQVATACADGAVAALAACSLLDA